MKKRLLLILLIFFVAACQNQVQETQELTPVNEEIPEPEVIEEPIIEPVEEEVGEPEVQDLPEETIEEPQEVETEPPKPEPNLINGKTVEERLEEAEQKLHAVNSEQHIWDNFPDIELVYTDNPSNYPSEILPFRYYYSKEADKTFNLCGVERTVFICDGKIEKAVTDEELDEKCLVTPIYLEN